MSGAQNAVSNVSQDLDILVVGAIDFGTTYSGWAFSFPRDFERAPTKAYSKHWPGPQRVTEKTPTCLLVNPDGKTVAAFGYEAEDKYVELVKKNEYEDYFFFKKFKMALNKKLSEKLDITLKLEDVRQRTLPAVEVFAMSIKYLLDDMLNAINKAQPTNIITVDNMMLVLTVPALWTDRARHFMREAAHRAGVDFKRFILALEPEVASVYCQYLPADRTVNKTFMQFPIGARYVVLDAGGGTVDIAIHETEDGMNNFSVKEVAIATGGGWGSSKVDEAFENFIIDLFGEDIYTVFKEESIDEWLELMRDIEFKKRSVDYVKPINIMLKIPQRLMRLANEKYNKSFSGFVKSSKYASGVTVINDKLALNSVLCKAFFSECIDKIVSQIENQLANKKVGDVRSILMVGGFSESKVLQHALKLAFPKLNVFVPKEASGVILKGAVLYGHHPMSITERVLKYTYGLEVMKKFKPGFHPERKSTQTENGKFCTGIFSKHVEREQRVKVGEWQVEQRYTPTDVKKTQAHLRIFASREWSPKFTDENCTCIGEVTFDLDDHTGDLNRALWVSFSFSGMDIAVEVFDEKTGKTKKAQTSFLGASMI